MNELKKYVEHKEVAERFEKLAPQWIKFESEKTFAMQILNNNSYLAGVAQADPASLMSAIVNIAATGLSLNPAEKQAYLIPRNVKVDGRHVTKIFLDPSYMGLCKLATDTGAIKWIQAACVYSDDTYLDNGMGNKPTHTFDPFNEDRGHFVGVYCVAKTEDGDYLTTTMSKKEIDSIMLRSEAAKKKSGPWFSDFSEMAKKAVIRRASKTWPKSNGNPWLAHAIEASNNNEGFEPILTSPNTGQYTAQQKEHFDSLIEKSDALGMYVLKETIDEGVYTNLYHSFEKGKKGKYQKIIDGLSSQGLDMVTDYVERLAESVTQGDDMAVNEIISELSQDELTIILARCGDDISNEINAIREAA